MKKRLRLQLVVVSIICIVSTLLLISCYSLSLEERMNLWSSKLPCAYNDIYWYNTEEAGRTLDPDIFIDAMQVPYGETRFSPDIETCFGKTDDYGNKLTDDTVFAFGVSLAPMLPANVKLTDDVIIQTFLLARIWFDLQGIPVYFSEEFTLNRYCFHVFATRDQIRNVTCNKLAALYIFSSHPPPGIREYYEKHA